MEQIVTQLDLQLILSLIDSMEMNFKFTLAAWFVGGFGFLFGTLSLIRIRRINKVLNSTELVERLKEVCSE